MGAAIASVFDLRSPSSPVRRGLLEARRFALPSGLAALDAILPDGGLPEGRLIELTGRRAAGKLSLALTIAANVLGRGDHAALVDPTATVLPGVLERPELERLLVVRGGGVTAALRATDALLRTGAFPLLVLDLPGRARAQPSAFVRLAREAAVAGVALVVLSEWLPWREDGLAALASVRLEVRSGRGPGSTLEVEVVKSKLGRPGGRARIDLDDSRPAHAGAFPGPALAGPGPKPKGGASCASPASASPTSR